MSELPNGWAAIALEELGSWGSGGTPKRTDSRFYSNGTIPWLVIGDLNDGVVTKAQTYITEEGLFNSSAKLLPPNTLLIAMYGSIGKLGITGIECATNQAIAFCVPDQEIIALRYLFHALKHSRDKLTAQGQGVAQKNISQTILKAHQIPVAPRREQSLIADKLDSLLARVDACRDRLNRVPRILKRFRQSILAAAISGKLTEDCREITVSNEALDLDSNTLPTGWEWKLMREVGTIQLGRQRAPKYHSGQHMRPYLRVQNIFEDRIDLSDVMEMDFPPSDFDTYQLVYGDILLNEGQSPEFLGRPAMYRDELPGACFTNTLIRFRAFDIVNRDFALLVFRHYMHCGRFSREGKITTNIAHLSAGRFANIEFPLPPLDEQQEIVRRATTLFSYADRLEVRYQKAFKRVEQITPALLSTAFQGELVPQDHNDEPATVLLERIRAEQIAKPKRVVVNRKPKMTKMTKESVKEIIQQFPSETFSFDELREKIAGDYDSFKDILFTLLSEAEPSLVQVFDQEAKVMRFIRGNQ